MKTLASLIICILAGLLPAAGVVGPVTGELKRWHKVTIDFTGPPTSEDAAVNPFTDYRLDVTFTHPASGKTYLVPGYFAADGDAANTSATAGDVWRVHFAPDEIGTWIFTASFRTGPDVATDDDPAAGSSAGYFDGEGGSIDVEPTDKTGRDFRGKGRLEYVGKHHLRFAGSGGYFMKMGTDSPENLLAYQDFDGDFKTDGVEDDRIKDWAPHVQDWHEGDPVWQGDKGKGLIGAVNYLASEGLNAFSFLTMNIDGDDENVFPYVSNSDVERMDVSRLDQWEIVFEHGTRMGMHLHFKTQETENERLLDNGNLGRERKLYYRELIARFSHNLALNWNLGEEINDATTSQKAAWARYFHDHDPYQHPIVIHNGDSHFDLMGEDFDLTGMSLQFNQPDFSDTFRFTLRYVKRSTEYNKPWVVAADEPGNSSTSLQPDDEPANSHIDARKNAIWGNIMAGGAGCEFYFGYNFPNSDLTCNDFRSRDRFWDFCRYALEFFEDHDFPFQLMKYQQDLVSGDGSDEDADSNRCLAKIGDTYLIQLHDGGNHTLDLTAASGTFTSLWFNPRTGATPVTGPMLTGGAVVPLGDPPDSETDDWIVLVESTSGGSATNSPPVVDAGPDKSAFLIDSSVAVDLNGSVADDGLPEEFALTRSWSQVSGPAEVSFSSTAASVTTATFTADGEYVLRLAANDSDLSAADDVVVNIRLPEPDQFVGYLPLHDAFLDAGANDNGTLLKVGGGEKTAYLKFDVPDPGAPVTGAELFLTEGASVDSGTVALRLYEAAATPWTETTLDGTNAPSKGAQVAVFSGEVQAGSVISFDLSGHVTAPGSYGFILEADPGAAEVAFASKENSTGAGRPSLVISHAGNNDPEFSGFLLATPVNTTARVPVSQILAEASDLDGDPLSLASGEGGTTAGGYVTFEPGFLVYTPSIDFLGSDSFDLTVQDGRGGFVSALLRINVLESDGLGGQVPSVTRLPDGTMRISFAGVAGFQYQVERSVNLVDWTLIGTLGGGETGEVQFIDDDPPEGAAFYRWQTP
ncbi:DUF5060 domain-containing protein [Luteolibacter marinus]|uniref:DUF5060 domain-containing protein n=1 Tax=Luteolibacter marinus TaxID=2776705 RepID=UPI001867F252|nr:DUF5060 domain-containing protein [Luteolibacter marinus]